MRFEETAGPPAGVAVAILFASYEGRSVRVAKALASGGYRGEVCVMYCGDLPSKQTEANLNTIRSLFGKALREMPVSYRSPLDAIRVVRAIEWNRSILIDVTCFNRANLFPFLWASGLGRNSCPDVTFAYSAPQHYGTWLSRDYDEPSNMLGFAGGLEFARERLLVCTVGYEVERVLRVIEAAEPSRVVVTVGTIPTRDEFLERNRLAVEEVYGSAKYEILECDVSDPEACMRDLFGVIKGVPSETAVHFAPFSTKLACLAIWGLWTRDERIRVWNAQPKTYNILDYSKGSMPPRYFRVAWEGKQS